jgi:hypothetical protein
MIVDGRIKLKSKTEIETFTKKGMKLTDGSELDADVVVLATGLVVSLFLVPCEVKRLWSSIGHGFDSIRKLVGDELAAQVKPIFALDEEKEPSGAWRSDTGVDNLWYALGEYLCDSY